ELVPGSGQYGNAVASGPVRSTNPTPPHRGTDPIQAEPLTSLAEIVGEANISANTIFPASTEEISEILKLASRERWNVLPTGGMTWLKPQDKSAAKVIVNTSRLNRIIEHEPADLIAIAQAGVKLVDFNAKLEESGQWLPLDPPDDGRATIGGVVATGLGGAQQFGYGRPRGSVIGMKVVMADGSVIKAGGRVVKNVAGYDLCKLFTGSYGSLGIITEVNFKLRPRPAREATIIATGAVRDLLSSARAILEARLFPVAAEIVSSGFGNRLGITTTQPVLLVRFAGNEKGVTYQLQEALARLNHAEVVSDDAQLWQTAAAAYFWSYCVFSWSTRILPSELLAFSERVAKAGLVWQIGALDGRVRMFDNNERTGPLFNRSIPAAVTSLTQRVKQQLDPLKIMPEFMPIRTD
ncbi:MAG TPA: FAD-binding oxidoreductase, partial [Pyrinomonadaceae bacterium]|nr:FAD-binding oxidoreductase [Pyrinomonadaceae bacterium]